MPSHTDFYKRLETKEKVPIFGTLHNLAGVAGFEPTNDGIKNRCLTTWRHPKRNRLYQTSLKKSRIFLSVLKNSCSFCIIFIKYSYDRNARFISIGNIFIA